MPTANLILGDCIEKMKDLPDASVDAVITDPPYGLEFMGKEWDAPKNLMATRNAKADSSIGRDNDPFIGARVNKYFAGQTFQDWCKLWASECLRLLKPGGFLFAMGGTRTHHRLTCGIEDAGFRILDEIDWVYFSGFPKAQDLGMMISKREGAVREGAATNNTFSRNEYAPQYQEMSLTENGKKWQGWKTPALKPAHEPIIVAQKPFKSSIMENVMKNGVGGFNVDECRIPYKNEDIPKAGTGFGASKNDYGGNTAEWKGGYELSEKGRFPANVVMTDNVFDGKVEGVEKANEEPATGHTPKLTKGHLFEGGWNQKTQEERFYTEDGGFSKFFLIPKSSKAEKNKDLEGLPLGAPPASARSKPADGRQNALGVERENFHPTVKPVLLMEWLIKLTTKEGATIIDPFMGSGTTGIAAYNLSRKFIGIEKEPEYYKIAQKRIGETQKQQKLFDFASPPDPSACENPSTQNGQGI